MPKSKDAVGETPTGRGAFPPYLTEITTTVKFDEDELAFPELVEALEGTPTVGIRADRGGVRGALRGMPGWGSAHAHYTVHQAKPGYALELEITSKSHGRFDKGVLSTKQFLSQLASLLNDPSKQRAAVIGAHFSFSMDEWEPTVPLPFAPPGTLDHIPGVPKISGLDFSFSSPGIDQPLIRAFVTTYEHLQQIVVRLLIARTVSIDPELPTVLLETADQYVPHFVKARDA